MEKESYLKGLILVFLPEGKGVLIIKMPQQTTPPLAERKTLTKITLDHPVIIGDAIKAIMRLCGGDCFGWGYVYRQTREGIVPIVSVYKTTKGEGCDTSRTIYNIDPNVVCTDYTSSTSQEFTISACANFPSEGVPAFERALIEVRSSKPVRRN